jgi:hypothetical protein
MMRPVETPSAAATRGAVGIRSGASVVAVLLLSIQQEPAGSAAAQLAVEDGSAGGDHGPIDQLAVKAQGVQRPCSTQ